MRRWAAVLLLPLAACTGLGSTTVKTAPAGSPSSSSGSAKPTTKAKIGDSLSLKGNESGAQLRVTVVKLFDPAKAGQFSSVPAGDRLVAVQVKLTNTGTASYSDAPSNGALVLDDQDQQYQAGIDDTTSCAVFAGGTTTVAPGGARVGCLTFEVPKTVKLSGFQFTLDSGFGPDTGQWLFH